MIQTQTWIKTIDNSGARYAKCIKTLRGFNRKYAKVGDLVLVSIRELRWSRKIKVGEMSFGIIARTKKKIKYLDSSDTKFKTNSLVLLNKNKKILSTRIFGPISKNLRHKKLMKLILMASYNLI